jgi:hypothetical protein
VTDEVLTGGNMGTVTRRGDTVLRPSGPWSPSVHALLRHVRAAGVWEVPEPLGFAADGREILSHLPGTVPTYPLPPWVWADVALVSAARLLARLHAVTATSTKDGDWRSPTRDPAEVVCRNDFAPYNLVFEAGQVVGVIDWDFASPGPRVWDVAYLAYQLVPLTAGDTGHGFAEADRGRRLRLLLDSYGARFTVEELRATVVERLVALADFSDKAALELDKPGLAEHAEVYRRDAARLGSTG